MADIIAQFREALAEHTPSDTIGIECWYEEDQAYKLASIQFVHEFYHIVMYSENGVVEITTTGCGNFTEFEICSVENGVVYLIFSENKLKTSIPAYHQINTWLSTYHKHRIERNILLTAQKQALEELVVDSLNKQTIYDLVYNYISGCPSPLFLYPNIITQTERILEVYYRVPQMFLFSDELSRASTGALTKKCHTSQELRDGEVVEVTRTTTTVRAESHDAICEYLSTKFKYLSNYFQEQFDLDDATGIQFTHSLLHRAAIKIFANKFELQYGTMAHKIECSTPEKATISFFDISNNGTTSLANDETGCSFVCYLMDKTCVFDTTDYIENCNHFLEIRTKIQDKKKQDSFISGLMKTT